VIIRNNFFISLDKIQRRGQDIAMKDAVGIWKKPVVILALVYGTFETFYFDS
jgi:hypothetical protein